jgi:DNA-binding beta-propeller fold protein YncE
VSQYDVGAGGLLAPKTPPTVSTGMTPGRLALAPDGRSLYVTNYGDAALSQYDVGPGGLLTAKTPASIPTGAGPFAVAVSPSGRSVYVSNLSAKTISQFDVGAGGTLTAKTPPTVDTGTSPGGIAVSPDGRSAYVTNYGGSAVFQYDVGAGELLSPKNPGSVTAGITPWAVAISPDGRSVYVTNYGVNTVSEYDVGPGGGLIVKTPTTVATDTSPVAITISPDGRNAYVTNVNAHSVSQYDVSAGGVLVPKSPATIDTGSAPEAVTVSPDGRSVYVTAFKVLQYDVGPAGVLIAKSPATVDAGDRPTGVALPPDQGPVAALSAGAAAAGSPSSFDASGSADSDGSVARYDWDFGDGSILSTTTPLTDHAYAAAGLYSVRVTVTDAAGCSAAFVFTGQTAYCNSTAAATATQAITVPPGPAGAPTPVADITAPVVSGYKITRKRFVVSAKSTPTRGVATTKKGTTFQYVLSESATARVLIAQRRAGRRQGRRCVAPTPKLAKRNRCTRLTTRGTLTRTSRQGLNRVAFSGRIGSRALKRGRYQATLKATDSANNASAGHTIFFTIVRR